MHILWTPSWYPSAADPFNGSFFAEQVNMLRAAGISVNVACLHPADLTQWGQVSAGLELDPYGSSQLRALPGNSPSSANRQLTTPAVYRGCCPTIPKGVLRGEKAIIAHYARGFARHYQARHGRPDLLHAHSVFPGILFAQALAKQWHIRYGLTEHRPSTLRQNPANPRFKAIKKAVQQADFRLTVSRDMAWRQGKKYAVPPFQICCLPFSEAFLDLCPGALAHAQQNAAPNIQAGNSTGAQADTAPATFRFIHISHLLPNKRPELILQAFAALRQADPHTSLTIVGGNQSRLAELTRWAAEKQLLAGVDFLGQRPRAEIPQLLATHHCLLLASQAEAGGTVLTEAHACGIPTISTATFAGKTYVNPDNGYLVPLEDQAAFTAAMQQAVTQQAHWRARAPQIRQAAIDLASPTAFSDLLKTVYQRARPD